MAGDRRDERTIMSFDVHWLFISISLRERSLFPSVMHLCHSIYKNAQRYQDIGLWPKKATEVHTFYHTSLLLSKITVHFYSFQQGVSTIWKQTPNTVVGSHFPAAAQHFQTYL